MTENRKSRRINAAHARKASRGRQVLETLSAMNTAQEKQFQMAQVMTIGACMHKLGLSELRITEADVEALQKGTALHANTEEQPDGSKHLVYRLTIKEVEPAEPAVETAEDEQKAE